MINYFSMEHSRTPQKEQPAQKGIEITPEDQEALATLGYRIEKEGLGTMYPVLDTEGNFAGLYYTVRPDGTTEWSGITVVKQQGQKKIRPENFKHLEDALAALVALGEFVETEEGRTTIDRMSDNAEKAGL